MRDRLDEFTTSDGTPVDVVVVTFTKPRNLRGYRRRFAEPLAVVTDENLELYAAMGFGRGTVRRMYGWPVIKTYASLIKGGARAEKTSEDTLQLGGNAIVDADGNLAWRYAGSGPDDRPSVDQIIGALKELD